MDPLLTSLGAALASLGPWGPLVGAAVILGLQFLRNRLGGSPSPAPSPGPADPLSKFPLLDALLKALRGNGGKFESLGEVPPAALVQIHDEVSKSLAERRKKLAAEMDELDEMARLKLKG